VSRLMDIYPAEQELPADRRAAIRAVVVAAAGEPAASRLKLTWRWAVVPAAVAVAVVVGLLQPWATPAAWASVPEQLDASAVADLGAECASRISDRHFPMALDSTSPVLGEARGTSRAVLLAGPSQIHVCVTGSAGDFLGVYEVPPLDRSSLGVVDGIPGSREGGEALRVVFGRLRSAGSTVRVTTVDGLVVTASVAASGESTYFLAWWPSHADAATVEVREPSGFAGFLPLPDQAEPSPASTVAD
jgi:hypothetical protein